MRQRPAAFLLALVLGVTLFTARPAQADDTPGPVQPCGGPSSPCIGVHKPGQPGGHQPGGGGPGTGGGGTYPNGCPRAPGTWYPSAQPFNPQPPKSDPIWGGHTDGAIYTGAGWCIDGVQYAGPWVKWFGTAPTAPTVSPAQLAQEALAALTIPKPVMHRSPTEANRDAGMPYTWVNLWTWYWTTPASWRTLSKTATLGGVWATVTVRPTEMVFTPGNGGAATTCPGPGRAWTEADGNAAPAGGGCGFRYTRVSKAVTSTLSLHWAASWTSSTGETGTLPVAATQATSTFKVQQIQVVNR